MKTKCNCLGCSSGELCKKEIRLDVAPKENKKCQHEPIIVVSKVKGHPLKSQLYCKKCGYFMGELPTGKGSRMLTKNKSVSNLKRGKIIKTPTTYSRPSLIEELELKFNYDIDAYEINSMKHSDSRIDFVAGKLNEVIKAVNYLLKQK